MVPRAMDFPELGMEFENCKISAAVWCFCLVDGSGILLKRNSCG